jgi:hypothetical protein
VPEVSSAAWDAVPAKVTAQDAAAIVPVLLVLLVLHRRRGRRAATEYLVRLAAGPQDTLRELAAAGNRACRLWALEALAGRHLLDPDVLGDRAMRDHDPVIALWCAQQLAIPSGHLPDGARSRLLGSARAGGPRVRGRAPR